MNCVWGEGEADGVVSEDGDVSGRVGRLAGFQARTLRLVGGWVEG